MPDWRVPEAAAQRGEVRLAVLIEADELAVQIERPAFLGWRLPSAGEHRRDEPRELSKGAYEGGFRNQSGKWQLRGRPLIPDEYWYWVEPDSGGGWRKRRGPAPERFVDRRAVERASDALIDETERELAAAHCGAGWLRLRQSATRS